MTELAPPVETGTGNPPPPPAPPPSPPPSGTDFKAALPEDIRGNPGLSKYTSVEALAKGYLHAQSMIGADKIVIPKEGDTEGWNKAFDAMGRPKDAATYDFKPVAMPDGMEYDTALEGKFRDTAHTLGLSQKQALAMRDWFVANQTEMFSSSAKTYEQERTQAETELKRELGQAYDGYLKASKAALGQYADPKFVAFLESSGLGNHPEMVRIFGKIGRETLGEEKLKAAGAVTEDSPKELAAKIADFRSQHNAALYDKMHPEHNRRVEELTTLTLRAYGDQPVQS